MGLFLTMVTRAPGDVVPRPLVITVLYATPAVIVALGAIARRRSLVLAAALLAIPGSVLSFAGVTLVFAVPGLFFVAAAAALPRGPETPTARIAGVVLMITEFGLVVAAGWAVLIGLTRPACFSIPGGSGCSSAAISPEGVVAAAALLAAAVGLAAVAAAASRSARLGPGQ
jgi:hypothetical protein